MTTIYVDGIRRGDVLNDSVISERAGGRASERAGVIYTGVVVGIAWIT